MLYCQAAYKLATKKTLPAIYDMYRVRSEKKNNKLYYVRIKNIYCDAYKIRETNTKSHITNFTNFLYVVSFLSLLI